MSSITLESTYGVVIHRNFIPLHIDDNYARMFGYESASDLTSKVDTLLDLISPEKREIAMAANEKLLKGEMKSTTQTHVNVKANGEPFTVLTLDELIEWDGLPALKVTVVDLSSIEKANKQIKENEKQYRELITKSAQGILIHRNFKPLLVNDAWVRLYHAQSIESVLKLDNIFCCIPEKYQVAARLRYQDLIEGKVEAGSIQVENLCFDGVTRTFNLYDNRIEWGGEPAVQTVVEDVTEKVQLEKVLEYKATHDQLTDLLNRDAVFDWLSRHASAFDVLACLIIDIDNFKAINDTYGHHAGDKVIKAFAHLCESEVGSDGIAARWGGEEFLVLLPDMDTDDANKVAEKIRQACLTRGCRCGDVTINSTVSIGVSINSSPFQKNLFDSLLKRADDKMYQAKKTGKNKVCF
ncbi:diguanylate cyclase [Vibrio sp. JC009]|uniref:sensor domain-containing diguanylate cyclase n=1 Tax=Vibrio sp. JC009 TaxID=2912314 RepID=UPI0023B14927|nr:sensor domain-containing diguanylate cyclase [Vibrio sp. JC009]WED22547.1 diguanylate cyclase [Vibrio sp. JC009]